MVILWLLWTGVAELASFCARVVLFIFGLRLLFWFIPSLLFLSVSMDTADSRLCGLLNILHLHILIFFWRLFFSRLTILLIAIVAFITVEYLLPLANFLFFQIIIFGVRSCMLVIWLRILLFWLELICFSLRAIGTSASAIAVLVLR